MTFNSPPPILGHQDYISDLSNKLASSISAQKDSIIFQALKENNAPLSNLTELMKSCSFIKYEGKNYQILNYNGRDILQINEPEITCEDGKFKVEVKYLKLYE